MRNRTDGGISFDETTREHLVTRVLSLTIHGQKIAPIFYVPQTIDNALDSSCWDAARDLMIRRHDPVMMKLVFSGIRDGKELQIAVATELKKEVCEMLYMEFTVRQAKAGNERWATPPTMQEIGPSPDEDEILEGEYLQ